MSHLTPIELETMKWMLEERWSDTRESVRTEAKVLTEETESLALDALGERDNLAGLESREHVEGALLERQLAELRDIAAALVRIKEGTYGICCDCGRPIVYGRLKAYPTAKRCTPCQVVHERDGIPSR